jgi:ribokinase
MNQAELFALTGESSISDAVAGLAEHGFERLVVKVGEMGSIVITPELTELIEGVVVDEVVNSAGAGDYYTAAFAHGIMEGYDLQHAARLGNVAGAMNVTRIGAQGVRLSAEALERQAEQLQPVESS